MTFKQEDIDQLAAYAAGQHISFQKMLTSHCRSLVSKGDYYKTFKKDFYRDLRLVEEVTSLKTEFTINASPAAAAIKASLSSLLSNVDDERKSHICNLLKAEVVYREKDALTVRGRQHGPSLGGKNGN